MMKSNHVKTYSEKVTTMPFDGTIIDLETIGNFNNYPHDDSRCYTNLITVIFGSVTKGRLEINYIENKLTNNAIKMARELDSFDYSGLIEANIRGILELHDFMKNKLGNLPRPFHAFNCNFEQGVLFNNLKERIPFDSELDRKLPDGRREMKKYTCQNLGIKDYGDPFCGIGRECSFAWIQGLTEKTIQHNRNCLLTEHDLLLKRGPRTAEVFHF